VDGKKVKNLHFSTFKTVSVGRTRKYPPIRKGDVSGNGKWRAVGPETNRNGRTVAPCDLTRKPTGATRYVGVGNFRLVPKTTVRHRPPVKKGDISGNGVWKATGDQQRVDGYSVVPSVSLDEEAEERLVWLSDFRRVPKTDRRVRKARKQRRRR